MWNNIKNSWPLILLTLIQGCILFYDLDGIPFYHDELSAIERCRFNSIQELIVHGVMVDGHPAGVQLFLYAMIKVFGIHEWILKLPFMLAGIGTLFFLYRTSEFVFSRYAAVTTGILFIFAAYFISQMVVARPYSIGLFFTLGAFYHAIKLKLKPFRKYGYIMFCLFSIGAMYAHYFSFMQTILVWGVVLLINHKKIYFRYYLIAMSVSILMFLPHTYITYLHLGMGGLGWLGTPDPSFFTDFLFTLFNSNLLLTGVAALLFILSFFVKKPRRKNKATLLILFAVPCIILYLYSILFVPVLQDPALYFCSPFLLLFIGNGIDFFNTRVRMILIPVICTLYGVVLIQVNRYYNLRNYQPIETFVIGSKNLIKEKPGTRVLFIWKGNSKYLRYFIDKQNFKGRIIATDTLGNIRKIDLTGYDKIVCNQLDPTILFELGKTYPFVEKTENNLLYTFMVLGKEKTKQRLYPVYSKLQFQFDSGKEWSLTSYTFELHDLMKDKFRFIEFVPKTDSIVKGAELVLETYEGQERIDWRSVYLEPDNILSIKLKDVIEELSPGQSIKIYIWNSEKTHTGLIEVDMYLRPDNPWEYQYTYRR